MKQITISILILLNFIKLHSDNLCWNDPHRRLRQTPIAQSDYCSCECWKYNTKNSPICVACGHRRTPEQIPTNSTDKKYPSHRAKRWEEKYSITQQAK